MQRTGRINQASYRIIVTEHTRPAKTGDFVEQVGTYNPISKERNLKADRVKYWLSVGAKPSGTVHNMLINLGILSGKKINVLPKKTVPKKEEEASSAVVAKAEEAPVVEEVAAPVAAAEESVSA